MMRVIFIGVVNIGWHCLKALFESEANIVGIFTADKQNMVNNSRMHPNYFSEFEDLASKYKVLLYKIRDVGVPLPSEEIKQLQPDTIFCIGWPQIISRDVLQIP